MAIFVDHVYLSTFKFIDNTGPFEAPWSMMSKVFLSIIEIVYKLFPQFRGRGHIRSLGNYYPLE